MNKFKVGDIVTIKPCNVGKFQMFGSSMKMFVGARMHVASCDESYSYVKENGYIWNNNTLSFYDSNFEKYKQNLLKEK